MTFTPWVYAKPWMKPHVSLRLPEYLCFSCFVPNYIYECMPDPGVGVKRTSGWLYIYMHPNHSTNETHHVCRKTLNTNIVFHFDHRGIEIGLPLSMNTFFSQPGGCLTTTVRQTTCLQGIYFATFTWSVYVGGHILTQSEVLVGLSIQGRVGLYRYPKKTCSLVCLVWVWLL